LTTWPRVAAVELVRVQLPLVRAHIYAGGQERVRDLVLVRAIGADGEQGWGECSALSSPGYMHETTEMCWSTLRDELAPRWLAGKSVVSSSPMAHACIEGAAVDLRLREMGRSLADELFSASGPRDSVAWCAVVGLHGDVQATLDEVDDAVAAGAAQIKLKIAPGQDLDRLRLVRDNHPDIPLAADANGSYASWSAVPLELADCGLTYLEQPVAPDDLAGSSSVEAALGIPVALDESVDSVGRLTEARERGAGSVLNVKVSRLGGLAVVQSVLTDLDRTGMPAFVGGMLESAVGRAVGLAVAAQAPCAMPCDLGPTSRYFVEDIGPSFEPDEGGRLTIPTGPGIGISPDDDALTRLAVERVTVRP
jgi:O-succinylbenzoate synthase